MNSLALDLLALAPVSFYSQSLPFRQQVVAIILGLGTLSGIIFLVRQRKLREEFAWMWLLTGGAIFLLSVWYDLLILVTYIIGAGLPTSALFFCGLLFVVGICLHFSIKLSTMANHVKNLSQEMAILRSEVNEKQNVLQSADK